ncbi:hypothetical protein HanXRQr2_Chr13g0616061 [Helianthus annuus]|uniref:Uncharacterized protein n=1 Tax=Helianthus annuus TaxID=4232 RepID=A0A9K3HE36_HELAN|nr:hypothetical protein HanXRQr2_Chr13g0616061 [Helianthus annuus]
MDTDGSRGSELPTESSHSSTESTPIAMVAEVKKISAALATCLRPTPGIPIKIFFNFLFRFRLIHFRF